MRRILDFWRVSDIPQLARRNYVAELWQMSLWGIVAGALEGPIAAVVVAKTFNASGLLTAIVFSIPISANLLNVVWSVILRGRQRIRTFTLIASAACVGILSIGLTDAAWGPWAARLFAAQMLFTHLFTSGLITLRTTMWRANYPQTHRAQIAGRLQTLRMLLSLLTAALLSALFDWHADYYRFVYPLVALVGLLSLWPLRRMRMRGEKAELRRLHAHLTRDNHNGNGRIGLWEGLKESAAILRHDRPYAQYMFAQFLLGSANFLTDPVLVYILTKRLELSYFSSTFLLFQVPIAVLLISIGFWARRFDRVGVLRFRIANSGCWTASYAFLTVAIAIIGLSDETAIAPAIAILLVARVLRGLGRGGGAIAWPLGHLHFAREHQTELYMGIHVALTGLRGLVMPLLGWAAYYYLDWGMFAIAFGFAGASHVLFRRLAAADHQPPRECASDRDEGPGPPPEVS